MLLRFNPIVFAACFILSSCVSSQKSLSNNHALPASDLHAYGRFVTDDKQNLELVSSGVHFGFTFEGDQCEVFAYSTNAGSHNYLQYELDGAYQQRLRIEGKPGQSIIIKAPKRGKHTVWVFKATEAHSGGITIEKISGNKVKALPLSSRPLIEFIGNSITCGAAADPSQVPCGEGAYHDQHNAYYAYGPRVARTLGTEFILNSVSGIGIYRNWNSNGPTMPQVYDKIDFQDQNTRQWNSDLFTPEIVNIALGTNDFSTGDGVKERLPFDSALFVDQYIQFVQKIKSKYPYAQVALLSSPMISGSKGILFQNCLTAVKNKVDALYPTGKPIALYFFKPIKARGCSGHPSVEDHAILAEDLEPFFRKLLQP
jgi:hypothetical protein